MVTDRDRDTAPSDRDHDNVDQIDDNDGHYQDGQRGDNDDKVILFGDDVDVDDDVHDDGDIDFDAHLYLCIFLSNSSWNAAWK